jgi:hypothetical protein
VRWQRFSSAADSTAPDNRQSALTPALYIVQGQSLNTTDKSVVRVNAKVEQEFEIIHLCFGVSHAVTGVGARSDCNSARQILIEPDLDL